MLPSISCQALFSEPAVYRPKPVAGADDLAVMRRIDELHLELPFYGSRPMTFELNKEGRGVNRKRTVTPRSRDGMIESLRVLIWLAVRRR